MTETHPLDIRLEPALSEQVTALASALDRPAAWVVEQAVKEFVALQEDHLAAIDEGLREADAGLLIPHEDVAAWVDSWEAAEAMPMPTPKST